MDGDCRRRDGRRQQASCRSVHKRSSDGRIRRVCPMERRAASPDAWTLYSSSAERYAAPYLGQIFLRYFFDLVPRARLAPSVPVWDGAHQRVSSGAPECHWGAGGRHQHLWQQLAIKAVPRHRSRVGLLLHCRPALWTLEGVCFRRGHMKR
jgi:hypothetical protein